MSFELPNLDYGFDALEPHIDALTMQIHHDKHHGAYVANLNKALDGNDALNWSIEDVCRSVSKFPPAVRNNGGGHYNHSMFWKLLKVNNGAGPSADVKAAIDRDLGGFDKFKETFGNAGITRFGSGWAWLVVTAEKKLAVGSTPNQDNPLMDVSDLKGTPILGMDVWEHAYYLKYQNRRPDYIAAFWNVINWDEVAARFAAGMK